MIEESDIRHKLNSILRGELDLDDFEDWLVVNSWNMHLDSSPGAQDLVWSIELSLAEYSSDYIAHKELISKFFGLLEHTAISVRLGAEVQEVVLPKTSSSGSIIEDLLPPIPEQWSAVRLLKRGLATLNQTNEFHTPLVLR